MRLIDAEQYRKEFLDSRDFEPMKILDFQTTVNAIVIPDNATNGNIIKTMFPNARIDYHEKSELVDKYVTVNLKDCDIYQDYPWYWWNAPYKKG